jgi:hypothetical protein
MKVPHLETNFPSEAPMSIAILQSYEQAAPQSWLTKLYSAFISARQKQADARLAHLATQHSAVAKAEQARAELRKYSIG